jgi:hypothetical protein
VTSPNRYPLERLFGTVLSPSSAFCGAPPPAGSSSIATTILTLALANTPWGEALRHLWEIPFALEIGPWRLSLTLHHWINEGLMALFFLVVGLELKREIMIGELSSLRNAALPVAGAIGGMLVPALIYWTFNPRAHRLRMGHPMATDIAFAVGILVLLPGASPAISSSFSRPWPSPTIWGRCWSSPCSIRHNWNGAPWDWAPFSWRFLSCSIGAASAGPSYALVGGCLWRPCSSRDPCHGGRGPAGLHHSGSARLHPPAVF